MQRCCPRAGWGGSRAGGPGASCAEAAPTHSPNVPSTSSCASESASPGLYFHVQQHLPLDGPRLDKAPARPAPPLHSVRPGHASQAAELSKSTYCFLFHENCFLPSQPDYKAHLLLKLLTRYTSKEAEVHTVFSYNTFSIISAQP